jgi:SAM-dependent methyltransferase
MNDGEIELMAAVEDSHWWYSGLRDIIRRTLEMPRFALPKGARVLDAGCGTGANLLFLRRFLSPEYLGGFDLSPLSVRFCREKIPDADIYVSDLRAPEIHTDQLDLVFSCDAVSIAGIAESFEGLVGLVERVRQGGLVIFNMPAFRWLFSKHDVAIETRDRTTVREMRELFAKLGLSVELITYRVFCLFPAILLARLPSMLRRGSLPREARSDVSLPPSLINATLHKLLCAENKVICSGVKLPWGSSVYVVGRKVTDR